MNYSYCKEIEVKYNVDVLVVGGGPSGVAAAWACAKSGKDVLIIENSSCFGGMGTIAKVPMFCMFTDGIHFLAGGFGKLIHDKCFENGAISPDDYTNHISKRESISIHAEKLKKIYDDVILESGAKVLFYTKLIDSICENGHIEYVICSGKSSIFAIKAKKYIDCTGDGVLAFYSGAEFEKGDCEGNMQAGTLCTAWTDIDWDKVKSSGNQGLWPINDKHLERAYNDGVFSVYDKHLPGVWRIGNTTGGANAGHAFGVDGTDEISLTKASFSERSRIWEYEQYYRNYVEGFENASILDSGEVMGIRETRRIKGEYTLTSDDYFNRADFDDEIGRYNYAIDIHASNSKQDLEYRDGYGDGESYGIPYSCLVAKDIDNLLVAGRCISCDRHMQASVRVMPGCFITGQAAGTAAGIAAEKDCAFKDVPVNELQESLVNLGAYLPNFG